jgi:hypothetical protein
VSQQINLFNPIFLKQKKIFGAVPMAEALGIIVAGALLMAWYASHRVAELEQSAAAGKTLLAGREARLARANTMFAPRQKDPALAAELAEAEAQLASLSQVESVLRGGALGNTAGYAEYFRAFSRQNVNGLWLTGLTIVGAGNDIGVQGKAMQPTLIPNYIARLTAEKVMHGKTFASLNIDRRAGQGPDAGADAAAAPAAPAAAGTAQAAPVMSPYVEFSLQSTQAGGAK